MRCKLTIAYDGTNYSGWQVQANALSIQTLVQKALETVLRHKIDLTGAGRTDSGVHALGQTAHFDTERSIDLGRLVYSANALLPPDIRILSCEEALPDFHARYRATGKIYHYHLQLLPFSDPTVRLYRTGIFGPFDRAAFRSAARHFIGTHDFGSFANVSHRRGDTVRTLQRLDIFENGSAIRLEFEGDGFLYKMVRNLTGTLLDVAAGRRSPNDMKGLLLAKDRRLAGFSAPPQGLFLIEVKY